MIRYAARIEALCDAESVLDLVWRVARRSGATAFSYHQTPAFDYPTSRDTLIFARGYSVEHQKAYVSGGFRDRDPLPAMTFEHGPVLTWKRAAALGKRMPATTSYFEEMRKRGALQGVSFSLFGPHNRDAYATLAYSTDPHEFAPGALSLLHSLLQTAHVRVCQIAAPNGLTVSLSERERDVLQWIARGKSSTEIGVILSLSSETVRTYTRRIFEKLGVNDRVAATVRALKLGVIDG